MLAAVSFAFDLAMWVHITAGTIAALVVFPVQILGPKNALHRRLGAAAVVLAWIIALSGFSMLVNPLFSSFWAREAEILSDPSINYGTYFSQMTYEPLFFLYLDVILLYLVITGVGVWKRVAARHPDGTTPPRPVDVFWNLLLLAFALGQLTLGIVDLDTDSGYAHSAIHVAIVMIALVAWDMWTWRDGGRHIHRWWTLHAGKLIVAWGGLFFAVVLRWRVQDELLETYEAWVIFGWAAVATSAFAVFGMFQHERRIRRAAKVDVS